MEELAAQPVILWVLLAILMLSQSTWLFLDARKRKSMPWFWGIWGLIQCPFPLIFYWLIVRKGMLNKWIKKNGKS